MSWIAVGVTTVSVIGTYAAGQQAKKAAGKEAELQREAGAARKAAAEFEANTLEVQAGQQIAAAQRDMLDVQRVGRLAQSRALALSAASGGGASAPTVSRLIGNLAKETSYNAARSLYAGEEKARLMRLQAEEKRKEGEFATTAGDLAGSAADARGKGAELASFGTMIGSVGGLYGKYGGNGPNAGGGKQTDYFQFTGYDRQGDYAYG